MSGPMPEDWVCEICLTPVADRVPQIRVGADVVERKDSEYASLNYNRVYLFAIFHSKCVAETMNDMDCEAPYLDEAREMLAGLDLCDECKASADLSEANTRHHSTPVTGWN